MLLAINWNTPHMKHLCFFIQWGVVDDLDKNKQPTGLKVNYIVDYLKLIQKKSFTTGIKDSAKYGKENNAYISVCDIACYYDSHLPGVRIFKELDSLLLIDIFF